IFFAYAGLLGGLVAISAGVNSLSNVDAVIVGLGAGIMVPMAALIIDLRTRLDDALGVIAIHGFGGIWGILAAGLLAPGDASFRIKLLCTQLIGIGSIIGLS